MLLNIDKCSKQVSIVQVDLRRNPNSSHYRHNFEKALTDLRQAVDEFGTQIMMAKLTMDFS